MALRLNELVDVVLDVVDLLRTYKKGSDVLVDLSMPSYFTGC